jgi:hypothetical protein
VTCQTLLEQESLLIIKQGSLIFHNDVTQVGTLPRPVSIDRPRQLILVDIESLYIEVGRGVVLAGWFST